MVSIVASQFVVTFAMMGSEYEINAMRNGAVRGCQQGHKLLTAKLEEFFVTWLAYSGASNICVIYLDNLNFATNSRSKYTCIPDDGQDKIKAWHIETTRRTSTFSDSPTHLLRPSLTLWASDDEKAGQEE